MKIALVKTETMETWGSGENSFNYWHRPLTVEEKAIINSHVAWTDGKKPSFDFSKFDVCELLDMAVTKIEGLYDSDEQKIDTLAKLKAMRAEPGVIDGVLVSMFITVWLAMNLPEDIKKKLSSDSTAQ